MGKAIRQLLLCLGLLALVFGTGSLQLGLSGVIFRPALFQLLLCGIKLGVGTGGAGGQLQLPLQKLQLHLAQSGLGLGHQLVVGEAGRGDQPLLVHLPLARIQLLLIALQLVIDVVVGGLRLGQRIPQLNVVFVLRLGLVQRLFGVAQGSLRVGQQGVCHLFQIDQQFDLLQLLLKFQHLRFAGHQLVCTALHGIRQGSLLGGKLLFTGVQLRLGGVQLHLCVRKLCLRLGKLALRLGLLAVVLGARLGQLVVGGVHQFFPPCGALHALNSLEVFGHSIHGGLIFIRIIIIQPGVFRLDIAHRIIIGGQSAIRHKQDAVQLAVAHGAALGVGGKVQRVLHRAHHREHLPADVPGRFRQGELGTRLHRAAVADHLHHALTGGLRHPAGQQHQAVHVLRRVGLRVGRQLIQPRHGGLLVPRPVALHVLILHRLHGFYPVHSGNGIDIALTEAKGGQHPDIEYILLHIVFLGSGAHIGRNAHQAGKHHHAQRHNAKQRYHPADAAFHLAQDIFAVTFLHSTHHSICSTGTGCSLT